MVLMLPSPLPFSVGDMLSFWRGVLSKNKTVEHPSQNEGCSTGVETTSRWWFEKCLLCSGLAGFRESTILQGVDEMMNTLVVVRLLSVSQGVTTNLLSLLLVAVGHGLVCPLNDGGPLS